MRIKEKLFRLLKAGTRDFASDGSKNEVLEPSFQRTSGHRNVSRDIIDCDMFMRVGIYESQTLGDIWIVGSKCVRRLTFDDNTRRKEDSVFGNQLTIATRGFSFMFDISNLR